MIARSIVFAYLSAVVALLGNTLVLVVTLANVPDGLAWPTGTLIAGWSVILLGLLLSGIRYYRRLPRQQEVRGGDPFTIQVQAFGIIGLVLLGLGLPDLVRVIQAVAVQLGWQQDPSVARTLHSLLSRADGLVTVMAGGILFLGARPIARLWMRWTWPDCEAR